mmetsp:Transcript_21568/g.54438  ORF Transcript_21568/g.54438 Transcript_21568/m.54438 type:complete len:931 (+) Transcript_21568:49-2841(+)
MGKGSDAVEKVRAAARKTAAAAAATRLLVSDSVAERKARDNENEAIQEKFLQQHGVGRGTKKSGAQAVAGGDRASTSSSKVNAPTSPPPQDIAPAGTAEEQQAGRRSPVRTSSSTGNAVGKKKKLAAAAKCVASVAALNASSGKKSLSKQRARSRSVSPRPASWGDLEPHSPSQRVEEVSNSISAEQNRIASELVAKSAAAGTDNARRTPPRGADGSFRTCYSPEVEKAAVVELRRSLSPGTPHYDRRSGKVVPSEAAGAELIGIRDQEVRALRIKRAQAGHLDEDETARRKGTLLAGGPQTSAYLSRAGEEVAQRAARSDNNLMPQRNSDAWVQWERGVDAVRYDEFHDENVVSRYKGQKLKFEKDARERFGDNAILPGANHLAEVSQDGALQCSVLKNLCGDRRAELRAERLRIYKQKRELLNAGKVSGDVKNAILRMQRTCGGDGGSPSGTRARLTTTSAGTGRNRSASPRVSSRSPLKPSIVAPELMQIVDPEKASVFELAAAVVAEEEGAFRRNDSGRERVTCMTRPRNGAQRSRSLPRLGVSGYAAGSSADGRSHTPEFTVGIAERKKISLLQRGAEKLRLQRLEIENAILQEQLPDPAYDEEIEYLQKKLAQKENQVHDLNRNLQKVAGVTGRNAMLARRREKEAAVVQGKEVVESSPQQYQADDPPGIVIGSTTSNVSSSLDTVMEGLGIRRPLAREERTEVINPRVDVVNVHVDNPAATKSSGHDRHLHVKYDGTGSAFLPLRFVEEIPLRLPSLFDEKSQQSSESRGSPRPASVVLGVAGVGSCTDGDFRSEAGEVGSRSGEPDEGPGCVLGGEPLLPQSSDAKRPVVEGDRPATPGADVDANYVDTRVGRLQIQPATAGGFAELLVGDGERSVADGEKAALADKQRAISDKIENAMRIFVLTSQMQSRALELEKSKTGF